MKIKPAPGLKVRDPVTKQFVEPGHEVDATDFYWHGRLRDGDVLPTEDEAPAETAEAPAVGDEQ